ncbi:MAG TPA: ATP-binding cassette domain-containing protein [Waddliaceae bacterium]
MLRVENVYFAYDKPEILQGVTFTVTKGEIVALIGISGSGKTTLFRLITGLITPLRGKIVIDGKSLPEQSLLTTYMRQDDLLLPWRTVMGNLLLFSEFGKKRVPKDDFQTNAATLLKKVGLEGIEKLYPSKLSGGMRQRVALARALLQNRPLLLLDEPFASLDVIMREQLYSLLRDVRDHYKKTIVMVTHDFRDAMALADRILVLSNGKIVGTYGVAPISETGANREALIQQIRADLAGLF